MRKRLLLVTGDSGMGKTTVLLRGVEALKLKGYSVGGMVSREVRTGGSRVGFEILDVQSGRRGWLAHVTLKKGPRVGKYRVDLEDLAEIGAEAILKATEGSEVIAIDEIGPMELYSDDFKNAVKRAAESGKLVIATIHRKVRNTLVDEVKRRKDSELYTVTYENRENLHRVIVERATEFLAQTAKG